MRRAVTSHTFSDNSTISYYKYSTPDANELEIKIGGRTWKSSGNLLDDLHMLNSLSQQTNGKVCYNLEEDANGDQNLDIYVFDETSRE